MNNRNNNRVLNEQQISDIKEQLIYDIRLWVDDTSDELINYYLTGNHEDFYQTITNWVEAAEDMVIDRINAELTEDSAKQDETNTDPNQLSLF